MNRRIKGGIAASLGALILAGSAGTFALWSDSATVPGDTITSGNLDVAAAGFQAFDVSADRSDATATTATGAKGHIIDPSTWRMVPGDTVELNYGIAVALEGDNLVANLDTSGLLNQLKASSPDAEKHVSTSVQLFSRDANGALVPATLGSGNQVALQADSVGQAAGVDDAGAIVIKQKTLTSAGTTAAPGTLAPEANLVASVKVTFDEATPDRVLTQTDLYSATQAGVQLTQIRKAPGA